MFPPSIRHPASSPCASRPLARPRWRWRSGPGGPWGRGRGSDPRVVGQFETPRSACTSSERIYAVGMNKKQLTRVGAVATLPYWQNQHGTSDLAFRPHELHRTRHEVVYQLHPLQPARGPQRTCLVFPRWLEPPPSTAYRLRLGSDGSPSSLPDMRASATGCGNLTPEARGVPVLGKPRRPGRALSRTVDTVTP